MILSKPKQTAAGTILGKYRIMRLMSIVIIVVLLVTVYQKMPLYYENGLNVQEWYIIVLLSACVLTSINMFQYSRKRDVTAFTARGKRLGGSTQEFFYENLLCKKCGQKRIPVIDFETTEFKQLLNPLPPGATFGNMKVSYYCTNCHDIADKNKCVRKSLVRAKINPENYMDMRSVIKSQKGYAINAVFCKQSMKITVLMLLITALSVFIVSLHWLLLLLMWLCAYFFWVSLYNSINNWFLRYWITSRGLVQRALFGYRLFKWDQVIAVLRTPPFVKSVVAAIYSNTENIIISPIIEESDVLIQQIIEKSKNAVIDPRLLN